MRIQGTHPVPLLVPRELDLGDRYDFDVVRAPLVRHLGFLLNLSPLSLCWWWLELLKEEAPTALHRLVVISVPGDELFQLSDLLAIHLLLSFILILQRIMKLAGSSRPLIRFYFMRFLGKLNVFLLYFKYLLFQILGRV